MLQALFKNKLDHAIQDGRFKGIEDTLTSSVIGLLQYLPDDLCWEILRGSCGVSAEILPESIGEIRSVHFWERLGAKGTHNTLSVEPDVWIETDEYDVIIEAKKSDSAAENAQYHSQWFNEIVALKNSCEGKEEKNLIFLAIGGNNTLRDQEINIKGNTQVIHTGSWFDLLGEVLHLRERIGRERSYGENVLRILDDVVNSMQYHNIVHTIWLDSLQTVMIKPDSLAIISKDWTFKDRAFLNGILENRSKQAIYSLSGIWEVKWKP